MSQYEKVDIKGRGDCFSFKLEADCSDLKDLIGESININGTSYIIGGVEACMHSSPWKKGEGVIVEVNNVTI